MIMYEEDADVVQGVLDLLGYQYNIPGYYVNTAQDGGICYNENYARGGNVGTNHCSVENDEVIALALQEELSQLAFAEATDSSHIDEEHMQLSVLTQDWMDSSVGNYSYGNEGQNEEGDDMEPSTSCSSPECCWGREIPSEPTDDYSDLDGEVGKRLNNMVSIRHVPRINGEIPSVDEATSHHQRLLDRLHLYDLVELKVQGDGNCQFRALSDQLYRTTEHHMFVRQQVVDQLNSDRNIYEGYVPMAYDDYLKRLSEDGEWGDHVTLQAAADSYGVKIFVITSFKDTCYIEILPNVRKSKRVIFLSFWAEVHYNSIYPEGDLPNLDMKKKKWWWYRK